jgi:hypothetical protein
MSTEEKEGKQRNEEIENQLKRDKMMQRNEIKMLLLGQYPHIHPPDPPLIALQVPVNLANRPFSSR